MPGSMPGPSITLSADGAWRSLVSALVWGTRGPEFKSRRPDHRKAPQLRGFSVRRSAPSLQAIRQWATRPIDVQREMNDPAVAAVIFVEQPEGLCGLTNPRLSTCVISASIVDREEG